MKGCPITYQGPGQELKSGLDKVRRPRSNFLLTRLRFCRPMNVARLVSSEGSSNRAALGSGMRFSQKDQIRPA